MKIAIIGTGRLGSLIGIQLASKEVCNEIVLIDKDTEKAKKQATDIDLITSNTTIFSGGYETTADCNIIVIAINTTNKDCEEMSENLKEIINRIVEFNHNAILLIATQPVDIATYIAYKVSGYDHSKVFGIGTLSDSSKIKTLLSKELNYNSADFKIPVIGAHGENVIPLFSCASLRGIPLAKLKKFNPDVIDKIIEDTKTLIKEEETEKVNYIIPAFLTIKVIEAIIHDKNHIFTLSFYQKGNYDVDNVALSLPVAIGSKGIAEILDIDLTEEEQAQLTANANHLKKEIAALEEN